MKRYDIHEPHRPHKARAVLIIALVGWAISAVSLTFLA